MSSSEHEIAQQFVERIRNRTLADVLHHLQGQTVSAGKLANIYGKSKSQIFNLRANYHPKPSTQPQKQDLT